MRTHIYLPGQVHKKPEYMQMMFSCSWLYILVIRHQHEGLVQDQVERLLGELQSLRGQLSAAQQRLDSQTAAASGTVANLEKRIAGLQTELQVFLCSPAHRFLKPFGCLCSSTP